MNILDRILKAFGLVRLRRVEVSLCNAFDMSFDDISEFMEHWRPYLSEQSEDPFRDALLAAAERA